MSVSTKTYTAQPEDVTFDEYDFSGKTSYVVNTSSGSRFVKEIGTIQELEPNATVIEGVALMQDKTLASEKEITDWLDALALSTN